MCNGRITRLIVSTDEEGGRNGGPNPIVFQIWKPTGNTTYRLFGMTELPEGVMLSRDFFLVNFSIPSGVNLFFHDGDVVGFYQPDMLIARTWTIRNNSYRAYRLRADNYTTTFNTSSDSVDVRNDRQPLIQVIHGKYCMECLYTFAYPSREPTYHFFDLMHNIFLQLNIIDEIEKLDPWWQNNDEAIPIYL